MQLFASWKLFELPFMDYDILFGDLKSLNFMTIRTIGIFRDIMFSENHLNNRNFVVLAMSSSQNVTSIDLKRNLH